MAQFREHNENPNNKRVGDCVIRAISTVLNQPWGVTFWGICLKAAQKFDMPSSNSVWGEYLLEQGYRRIAINNECNCYTVEDFCNDHPKGRYVLGTGTHAIGVVDGEYFDIWQSGGETPIYYFESEE